MRLMVFIIIFGISCNTEIPNTINSTDWRIVTKETPIDPSPDYFCARRKLIEHYEFSPKSADYILDKMFPKSIVEVGIYNGTKFISISKLAPNKIPCSKL